MAGSERLTTDQRPGVQIFSLRLIILVLSIAGECRVLFLSFYFMENIYGMRFICLKLLIKKLSTQILMVFGNFRFVGAFILCLHFLLALLLPFIDALFTSTTSVMTGLVALSADSHDLFENHEFLSPAAWRSWYCIFRHRYYDDCRPRDLPK